MYVNPPSNNGIDKLEQNHCARTRKSVIIRLLLLCQKGDTRTQKYFIEQNYLTKISNAYNNNNLIITDFCVRAQWFRSNLLMPLLGGGGYVRACRRVRVRVRVRACVQTHVSDFALFSDIYALASLNVGQR